MLRRPDRVMLPGTAMMGRLSRRDLDIENQCRRFELAQQRQSVNVAAHWQSRPEFAQPNVCHGVVGRNDPDSRR